MSDASDSMKQEFLKQNLYLLLSRKLYDSSWMKPKPLTKKEIENVYETTVCMVDELYNENQKLKLELLREKEKIQPIATPIYFNDIDKAMNALCLKKNKRLSYFIVKTEITKEVKDQLRLYNYRKNGNEWVQLNVNLNTIIRVISKWSELDEILKQ